MNKPIIHDIKLGQRVRSFDFPNWSERHGTYGIHAEGDYVGTPAYRPACYWEGVVVAIVKRGERYSTWLQDPHADRYVIEVERRVWNGVADPHPPASVITAPVNGTRTLSLYTFGVQPVEEGEQA
tara:strand:- start:88 stop:462 length:375 start_codon:yes stop_codon:yes gene_type:complete